MKWPGEGIKKKLKGNIRTLQETTRKKRKSANAQGKISRVSPVEVDGPGNEKSSDLPPRSPLQRFGRLLLPRSSPQRQSPRSSSSGTNPPTTSIAAPSTANEVALSESVSADLFGTDFEVLPSVTSPRPVFSEATLSGWLVTLTGRRAPQVSRENEILQPRPCCYAQM